MRLVWEIVTFLYRAIGVHPLWIAREVFIRVAKQCRLFWYMIWMLLPNREHDTRWFRCDACNRLCHTWATPNSLTAEEGRDGIARLVGRCLQCEDKRA